MSQAINDHPAMNDNNAVLTIDDLILSEPWVKSFLKTYNYPYKDDYL
jgi:hypothetical protein